MYRNIFKTKKIILRLGVLDYFIGFVIIVVIALSSVFLTRENTSVYIHTEASSPPSQEEKLPHFYWLSNSVAKGERVSTRTGGEVGEVVEVLNIPWRGDRRYTKLKIKINTIFNKNKNEHRVGDTPLLVGDFIDLTIGNTHYQGVITYVGDTLNPPNYEEKYLKVHIKVLEVEDWLARLYADGDFVVKDVGGREVFRVVDANVVPHETTKENSRGMLVRTLDPVYKDVAIIAKVFTSCEQGECYFSGSIPIKVGGTSIMLNLTNEKALVGLKELGGAWITEVEDWDAI